jgi:hypothetical protein
VNTKCKTNAFFTSKSEIKLVISYLKREKKFFLKSYFQTPCRRASLDKLIMV